MPILLIIFAVSCNICFAQDTGTLPFQGEINTDNINLRSDSTVNSKVICNLNRGDKVEVISGLYDWYKIRIPQSASLYVKKALLECISRENTPTASPGRCISAKAVKEHINVRLEPLESSPILGRLDKNEVVSVKQEEEDWFKIEPITNSFGWINKKFVSKTISAKKTPVSQKPKLEENINEENIVLEGVVKPYGMVFNRKATHKLITQENQIYLLKANKKSLDALNYKKVKVIGKKLDSIKEKYPVIEVKFIEVIS